MCGERDLTWRRTGPSTPVTVPQSQHPQELWEERKSTQSTVSHTRLLSILRFLASEASCVGERLSTITDVKVSIGEHSICDGVTNEGGSWISAKRVVNHPNYGNHDNDIAVLELSEDITFTANIKPACLPTSATKDYSNLASTISGWGGTIGYSGAQPQQPRQCELKESVVKVLSPTSQKCSSFLGTTTPNQPEVQQLPW